MGGLPLGKTARRGAAEPRDARMGVVEIDDETDGIADIDGRRDRAAEQVGPTIQAPDSFFASRSAVAASQAITTPWNA